TARSRAGARPGSRCSRWRTASRRRRDRASSRPRADRALAGPRRRRTGWRRARAPPTTTAGTRRCRRVVSLQAGGADRALDEPLHVQLESVVGVGDLLAGGQHLRPLVVLEWALVELQRVIDEPLTRLEHRVLHVLRHGFAERAQRHHLLAEAAAVE